MRMSGTHLASGTPIAKSHSSPAPKSVSKLAFSSVQSTPRSKVSVFKGDELSVDGGCLSDLSRSCE